MVTATLYMYMYMYDSIFQLTLHEEHYVPVHRYYINNKYTLSLL